MNNSVSAKKLAEMVICEASVVSERRNTSLDVSRLNKGIREHKRFELAVQSVANTTKPSILPRNDSIGINSPTNLTTQGKGGYHKARSVVRIALSVLIIIGAITITYMANS